MQNCPGLSRPFHGLTQAGRPQPGTGDIWTLSQPQATVEPALCLPSGVEHSRHLALQGALMMDEREGPAAGLSQGSEGHFPDSSSGATPWDKPQQPYPWGENRWTQKIKVEQ